LKIPAFMIRLLFILIAASGTVHAETVSPMPIKLHLRRAVFLEGSQSGNTSGLAMPEDGYLYLVDDRGPAPPDWKMYTPVLYRVPVDSLINSSALVPPLDVVGFLGDTKAFASLAGKLNKQHKFDFEGLMPLGSNRFWVVDERDHLVLELDIVKGSITLVAGAKSLLKAQDDLGGGGINRSFEGITRIGSQLFLAHEMLPNLVLRYQLEDNGSIIPAGRISIEGSLDLTDADNDGGNLYLLGRMNSMVYKVAPDTGRLLARADFSQIADSSAFRYENPMDFFRNSEGLAVKDKFIYVVLDGNGKATLADPDQKAPLLLIFDRPPGF
jgi:Esterase-like activity of phytase